MMRRAARFLADQARRQLAKKPQYLSPAQRLATKPCFRHIRM
jgi:hypothetical protein